ncbi:MAG: hypothetical protein KDK00_03015 [Rhodobacteraceae bacterium]|nr:hypothetical protein [Paracoccaceae bacterium]
MIRLAALLLWGALLTLPGTRADAEGAGFRVRSGEHAGFSRLVLDFTEPVAWELRPTEVGYDLHFPADIGPADLGGVFRLIPRSRLQGIEPVVGRPGTLRLRLAADHRADAFALPDGKLVIDISPGKRPEAEDAPDAAGTLDIASAAIPQDAPLYPRPPNPQLVILQPPGQLPEMSPAGTDRRTRMPRADVPPEIPGPPPEARLPDMRLIAAQDRLVLQLGRAMSQGVVDPSTTYQPAATEQHPLTPEPAPPGGAGDAAQAALAELPATSTPVLPADPVDPSRYLDHLNLDARTIYDRTGIGGQPPPATGEPAACLDDALFDFAVPEGGAAIRERIGQLRASLAGEFDRPDIAVLDALIRLYIGLGFGAEALALMETFPGQPDQAPLYRELAEIMQRGHAKDAAILPRDAQCTGASGLWAIMSRPAIPLGEEPDGPALAHYFADLPADLRRRIGPTLGIRMLEAGFVTEARLIADRIARAPGPPDAELVLLTARIDLGSGRKQAARRALTGLVESDQTNAPEALVILLGDLLEDGEPVPAGLLTEASAIAFELRFSAAGARLRRMEILAHAASGAVARAFDILIHEVQLGTLGPADMARISTELFQHVSRTDTDAAAFAGAYFGYRHLLDLDPGADPVRRQVAGRLMQIGLPSEALALISETADRHSAQDRLLAAEALLTMENPDAAEAALGDLTGPAAETLRWRIDAARAEYGDALRRDGAGVDQHLREDAAWRSGRWDLLGEASPPTRQTAARLAEAEADMPDLPDTPALGDFKAVLEASRQARRDVEHLLDDHPSP